MQVKDLKNYGVPLTEMMECMPNKTRREAASTAIRIIKKNMGLINFIKYILKFPNERRSLSRKDISILQKKGLYNKNFIKQQIDIIAAFSVMGKILGIDKTLEIFNEIMDRSVPKIYLQWMPDPEDYKKFDHPFNTFKEWYLTMCDALAEAGGGDYVLIENNNDILHLNVTYCPWYEIPKLLGVEKACLFSCHADEVALPDYCEKIGIKFKRTKALGHGDDCCDYKFERET